jgi:aminopeptidase
LSDPRVDKTARILVEHSTRVKLGDRVVIEATTAAEPLVQSVYKHVLECGGQPHLLLSFPDQEETFFRTANNDQLDFTPTFHKLAADQFEARIRIYSDTNTRALSEIDPARQARRLKALAVVQQTVNRRSGEGVLKWVSTLFPTNAYAMEAEMGMQDFVDFYFRACHADEGTPDPLAYWKDVEEKQNAYVKVFEGRNQVLVRGDNTDLAFSIKGRKFINASGQHNLPDGEVYTSPVEESVNGWVRFTYPATYQGVVVEGAELTFVGGNVVKAAAQKNQNFLLKMLDSDSGARFLGEFAIGTNYGITHAIHHALFDEKIGGSFHLALGMGYPEKAISTGTWSAT